MQPIHVIQAGCCIGGVTSLGDEVFIVCWNCVQIEVFDSNTMSPVPGLGPTVYCGLAACIIVFMLIRLDIRMNT